MVNPVLAPVATQQFQINGVPLSGGKLFTYAAGITTKQATYTDATGTTQNTNPIIINSQGYPQTGAGQTCGVWLDPSLSYKFVLAPSTDTDPPTDAIWVVDNITQNNVPYALSASNGSASVGFIQSGTGAVTRTAQAKMREAISVQDFGAVGDGVTDDYPAFLAAFNAAQPGQIIRVPYISGAYHLSANPYSYTKSVRWYIDMGVTFTGAGGTGLTSFGRMYTNPYAVAAGPWDFFIDTEATPSGGVTVARSIEILSPATGANSQLALYLGADNNGNTTTGNIQEILNLVQNVHKADVAPFGAIYKAMEIDVNVDVNSSGGVTGADVFGLLFTGGGAGGPYQGDATYGIIFQRTTANWFTAIDISNCYFGVNVTAQNTAFTARHYYTAAPQSLQPSGLINRCYTVDNIPSGAAGGQVFSGAQLANNYPTMDLWRNTDTSPTGTFMRCWNQASNSILFSIGIDGSLASFAPSSANGSSVSAGGIACNGLTLRGTTNLQLGVAATAASKSATGKYLSIVDSTGTTVYIPTYA